MSNPFLGEIKMFGGNFAPVGWLFCNGQLVSTAEYETLFALIGTTYGGDGQSTFALPDLRGRIPLHTGTSTASGNSFPLAVPAGSENVTLTTGQIPAHSHPFPATSAAGTSGSPNSGIVAAGAGNRYNGDAPTPAFGPMIGVAGSIGAHPNMMPYLCVSFIISMFGIFPSQA